MRIKTLGKFIAAAAVAVTMGLGTGSAEAQTRIYVDPGHGGSDPGAVHSSGTTEASRVLYTGLRLRDWLNAATNDSSGGGTWAVRMSRTTNVFVGLSARATDANNWNAARFHSIHFNAFNGSARGTETFSATNGSSQSHNLRDRIQEEAILAWGFPNRGSKTANFTVLTATSMPAALSEGGFIDNNTDHAKISNNAECNTLALRFLYAKQRHYGQPRYQPGTSVPNVIVDDAHSGFSVSGNWWWTNVTPGYYGSGYHVRGTATVSDTAKWTVNTPVSGSWRVQVRYAAGANRASAAPYIVSHNGGNTTVNVNQRVNGGTWVTLGNFNFSAGSSLKVQLSCWTTSGDFVIADAVRFQKL